MRTTAPGQSALLLLDVIDLLNKRHIPYAIIGAFAASFYGVVRASLDADAVISIRTVRDGNELCQDLKVLGLSVERRTGDHEDPIAAVINIQDSFHNRVDLLTGIRGMSEEAFHRAEETRFMKSSIKMVSLEDFIAMKIFAGSPKDLADVIGVLEVSNNKVNASLLKELTAAYGKKCLAQLQAILKAHPLKN